MSFGALNVIQRCEPQHHALLINSVLAASIDSLAQSLKKIMIHPTLAIF
jgi:hypothetical protein